ncbi:hypothetical protein PT286_10110, partial [Neisseriaceae bacterium ESL0693]|nr:hypothetical protein [Neisseriaceae bacterium ESL0693]
TAGIVAGVPVEIGQSMEDLLHMVTSPIETYNAIKSLINSDDIFGNVSDALKQEYSNRIDNLINQYEQAGASGSFQAGVEIGRLLTDAGTLVAGGIGVGKGVAKVTDKVIGKLAHESMYTPELAGVGNIKLPADTLADGTPLNKKPAKGSAQAGKDDKVPYEPNQGAIANMGDYFKQPGFGSELGQNSRKTSKQYQGQTIYVASNKNMKDYGINKGDQFYLDGSHKNHIEVFDQNGDFKGVLNLDGTPNKAKSIAGKGRKLPK